jgi:hypothetical protein
VTTIHVATGEGESLALIADVHGNRWALEGVLADIQSRGVAEHVAMPYAWDEAARAARANGRPDWSEWLSTGWARR